jgi:hypothetical protein
MHVCQGPSTSHDGAEVKCQNSCEAAVNAFSVNVVAQVVWQQLLGNLGGVETHQLSALLEAIHMIYHEMVLNYACFSFLKLVDENIADISAAKDDEPIYYQEATLTRIGRFQTNEEALLKTNFKIEELCRILHLFGLPLWNHTVQGYKLHHKEILIYLFITAYED